MDAMTILKAVSAFIPGDSKIMSALKQAVEIANSGKYPANLKGALQVAKDYGFDENSFRKMEALSKNPKFLKILSMVAPESTENLKAMFSQLSSSYLNKSNVSSIQSESKTTEADDFSERMKRLNF